MYKSIYIKRDKDFNFHHASTSLYLIRFCIETAALLKIDTAPIVYVGLFVDEIYVVIYGCGLALVTLWFLINECETKLYFIKFVKKGFRSGQKLPIRLPVLEKSK